MTTIKLRGTRLAISALAAIMLGPSGVQADSTAVRDPNDSAGRLDVKVLRHGHTATGALKHVIVTRDKWTRRAFGRKGTIFVYFSFYGDTCADAWVLIDRARAKELGLRARWQGYDPLGCPNGDDDGGYSNFYGDVRARKPARDRVVLVVPRRLFPVSADAYHWAVTTAWTCDERCGDNAPDRANSDRTKIRHEL